MPPVETQLPETEKKPQPRHDDNDGNGPRANGDGHGAPPKEGDHQQHGEGIPKDLPKPSAFTVILVVVAFVVLLAGLLLLGLIPHLHARAEARSDASARSNITPVVQVMTPKPPGTSANLRYPCDVRANQTTDLYPRSNGYLKRLYVDIQDHAEANQLLAEIDEPEVDAELAQTKANLAQAQANVAKALSDLDLAQKTLDRYLATQKTSPGSVSQQEVDQNESSVEDARAALAQAKANVVADQASVQQLTVTQGFEKVYAPFSGTVTARNYDVGALLSPTTTAGKQLFSIAQTDPLRVFVNVPQSEATEIKQGQSASLVVTNYPDRAFKGFVARTSGSIDQNTRTLTVEIHFPNKDGTLLPGMYGQISLETSNPNPVLLIPSSALVFNADGLRVAIVKDNKIHMQDIRIGRDLGTELEVVSGLNAQDQVVTNPGARLEEGVIVQVPPPAQASADNK